MAYPILSSYLPVLYCIVCCLLFILQSEGQKQAKVDELLAKRGTLDANHPRAQAISDAIAKMMAIDYQPYSLVEDRGFVNLLSVLEPRYHVPSRTTFSRFILPKIY